jgi:ABC-type Fe3+-hydroxamate transport system substrate-binding protein
VDSSRICLERAARKICDEVNYMRSRTVLIGLAGLLLGSALAASITIRDGLGRQVTVNAPVKRVVALSLTATEVMLDIGLSPIGRPSSATFPEAKTKAIQEVGSAYRPDIEKIVALKPDLLLGSVGTTAAQARALGALPTPLIVTADSSLKDVYDTYTTGVNAVAEQNQPRHQAHSQNCRQASRAGALGGGRSSV